MSSRGGVVTRIPSIARGRSQHANALGALCLMMAASLAMIAPREARGAPSLALTPVSTVIGVGGTMRYQAIFRQNNGSTLPVYLDPAAVDWSTSSAGVLSIDAGLAIGHQPGSVTVT